MLEEIADGVWVRQSAYGRSNATAIRGPGGVLLVDPGISGEDMEELADGLAALGLRVGAGFATHPHWDHVLWHPRFGDAPRYGTARCATVAAEWAPQARERVAESAKGVPLDLVGVLRPLPDGAAEVPWDGPTVRLIEHDAHCPAHTALLVPERGVLLAADMLSDIEMPLLDAQQPDQITTYLAALDLLEAALFGVTTLVPGHGAVARDEPEIQRRLAADRAYVEALRRGDDPGDDPRLAPDATYDPVWLAEMHLENLRQAGIHAPH